ncbi:hypothetical protein A1O7_08716 [Cladophialophora yegresii CBS 114405]|uniref:SRP9 domain-containing protein n=1 Tax=Cladophialophora yegresii CBS 114405 TaxID=1182544 RepID=W9VUD2_9EURO|nr:uncharacterized protein A1O7_08716 [Cladophialophora yegresii CBS 114405]EXJ55786.1 hypothetical protein A1O7_08716 [Cladophialophora yegresii CBS 114405]
MPYFSDLNIYLHQSSLLIQAYPTTRITTKYSLPRKPNAKAKSKSKPNLDRSKDTAASANDSAPETSSHTQAQPKRDPSATLTLKTYHPESGICLKYRTDKAAEVGRLLTGLGRLARGETIEPPSAASAAATATATTDGDADKMDIDGGAVLKMEDKVATAPPVAVTQQAGGGGGGGGKAKKKKGKK